MNHCQCASDSEVDRALDSGAKDLRFDSRTTPLFSQKIYFSKMHDYHKNRKKNKF